MAKETNHPYGKAQQGENFKKRKKLEADVYDFIKETLVNSTEKAFKDVGMDGKKGYAGEYGDGTVYGSGVKNNELNIRIGGKTKDYFEKNISLGGKRFVSEIHMSLDADTKVLDLSYSTNSQMAFRGHKDKKGGYMVEKEKTYNISDMEKFKKELKKDFKNFAEKEVGYITNTKIGIEDRIEKSINSMVENMEKLSLKNMLSGSFEELSNMLSEDKNKDDTNHPDVKKQNSPGNLLFDDKEDVEDEVVGKKTNEVTASGGNAAGGAYNGPAAFAKGGDFDDEMSEETTKSSRKLAEDRFQNTPYMQNQISKPNFQFQRINEAEGEPKGDKFWQIVDLNAGSGYVPKGMEKNHAMGQHATSDELGSEKEVNDGWSHKKTQGGKKKEKVNESVESKQMGKKDRRIIESMRSLKTTTDQQKRWNQLVEHKTNETIKRAASVISDEKSEMLSESRIPTKKTKSAILSEQEVAKAKEEADNMYRKMGIEDGGMVGDEKVVIVSKPNSLTNVKYTVPEVDYLNEGMAYIWDFTTGNLVNNPNYKIS